MMPDSSPASATIILKVEPGGYCPATALLLKGVAGLDSSSSHNSALMPSVNWLGSKLGWEDRA